MFLKVMMRVGFGELGILLSIFDTSKLHYNVNSSLYIYLRSHIHTQNITLLMSCVHEPNNRFENKDL